MRILRVMVARKNDDSSGSDLIRLEGSEHLFVTAVLKIRASAVADEERVARE